MKNHCHAIGLSQLILQRFYARFHIPVFPQERSRHSCLPVLRNTLKVCFHGFLRPDVFTVEHVPPLTCSTRVIYSEGPPYPQSSVTRPAMQTPVANERISVKHSDLRLQFTSSSIPREFQVMFAAIAQSSRDFSTPVSRSEVDKRM